MNGSKAANKIAVTLSRKGRSFGSLSVVPRFMHFQGVSTANQNIQSKLRRRNARRTFESFFSSQASSLSNMINSKIDSNKVRH
jgi:hypothetical protein